MSEEWINQDFNEDGSRLAGGGELSVTLPKTDAGFQNPESANGIQLEITSPSASSIAGQQIAGEAHESEDGLMKKIRMEMHMLQVKNKARKKVKKIIKKIGNEIDVIKRGGLARHSS